MANEKILVVDDDTNICELLRLYLTKEGYQVTTANDGEEGLEKFDQVKPDMVLLDVMMVTAVRTLTALPFRNFWMISGMER